MKRLFFKRFILGFCACVAAFVTGCAGVNSVDVDVTAFANWGAGGPPAAGSSYRFERLPSQQIPAFQYDQLETATRAALARKGLEFRPSDSNPGTARYSVQVSSNVQVVATSNGYPYGPTVGVGTSVISGGGGGFSAAGIGFGFPVGGSGISNNYRTEVVVLVRNLQSNMVVYESHAYAQSGSPGDPVVLQAMADSALRDFPIPPVGIRRFTTQIPPGR